MSALRQYAYQSPGPRGVLRVARPELTWPFRPSGGATIVRIDLTLNDRSVLAEYDSVRGVIRYRPFTPLAPGTYRVVCTVTLRPRQNPARTSWEFTIAPDALATLPPPSAWAQSALVTVNALRTAYRLPTLRLDERLCAAAQAHADYLTRNSVSGHFERPDRPGFVGEDPRERAQSFGFSDSLAENVSIADGPPEQIVRGLFDAPYHRLPYLRPGALTLGAGHTGRASAFLFGGTGSPGVTTSPFDGETGVPTAWRNDEQPSPLRMHVGAKKVVGYPILLAHYAIEEKLALATGRLTTASGSEVACYVNSPENDNELHGVLLIPKAPLSPGTIYIAEVQARDTKGRDIVRRWRFTTGESDDSTTATVPLQPGEVKLSGIVQKLTGETGFVLLVRDGTAYGNSPRHLDRPVAVTVRVTAQTRAYSEEGNGGQVQLRAGSVVSVVAPSVATGQPYTARALLFPGR